jgi:hypothetical protein
MRDKLAKYLYRVNKVQNLPIVELTFLRYSLEWTGDGL